MFDMFHGSASPVFPVTMNSFPKALILIIAALVLPLPGRAQNNASGTLAIVASPLANVRSEPAAKTEIVTQVLMADEVRVLERQDTRYRIAIPSQGDIEGWVQQEALIIPKDGGKSYLNGSKQWIVIVAPKTEALILDKTGDHKVPLYAGTRLPVIETAAEGYKVRFPDRSVAVINTGEARPARSDDPLFLTVSPQEIARTARQFLNAPYLAGGITAQGMDSRGLIYTVYRIHGIELERRRSGLKARAERVQKKDLLPGDILVFFGEGESLYIGNGRFLHGIRKHSVQVGGIYDRRYANALQYGLRILGSDPEGKKLPKDMTADEIMVTQARVAALPQNKRIAYWAGRFIGTPYDPDPLGRYVRTNRIVADEKIDCMYHTFRSAELAMTQTPGEAIAKALDLRFISTGRLEGGLVANYDERFQYGEDMVFSGKWGRNITAELGTAEKIPGSRGREDVEILPKKTLMTKAVWAKLQDGDIIYWVKDPKKRVVEEIVAHLSTVHIKDGKPYVIHAAGDKDRQGRPGGGKVKEVLFSDYVGNMRFIGAFVTRFEQ
jgi:cell wall-associated NlpC family hydrolase